MRKHREYLTLILQADAVYVCWFRQPKERSSVYFPQEWHEYPLNALQVAKNGIYNLTFLTDIFVDFIKEYKLRDVYASIALGSSFVLERCLLIEHEYPTLDDVALQARSLIWNYAHIKRDLETMKNLFYVFGIERHILFQYQLLALKVPFHCITITTTTRASLYAISRLAGNAFQELIAAELDELLEFCKRTFCVQFYDTLFKAQPLHFNELYQIDKEIIMAHIGLYFLGRDYELS